MTHNKFENTNFNPPVDDYKESDSFINKSGRIQNFGSTFNTDLA